MIFSPLTEFLPARSLGQRDKLCKRKLCGAVCVCACVFVCVCCVGCAKQFRIHEYFTCNIWAFSVSDLLGT